MIAIRGLSVVTLCLVQSGRTSRASAVDLQPAGGQRGRPRSQPLVSDRSFPRADRVLGQGRRRRRHPER